MTKNKIQTIFNLQSPNLKIQSYPAFQSLATFERQALIWKLKIRISNLFVICHLSFGIFLDIFHQIFEN